MSCIYTRMFNLSLLSYASNRLGREESGHDWLTMLNSSLFIIMSCQQIDCTALAS